MAGEPEREGPLGTRPHEMLRLPPLPEDEGLISSQEPRSASISPQRHVWSRKQDGKPSPSTWASAVEAVLQGTWEDAAHQ